MNKPPAAAALDSGGCGVTFRAPQAQARVLAGSADAAAPVAGPPAAGSGLAAGPGLPADAAGRQAARPGPGGMTVSRRVPKAGRARAAALAALAGRPGGMLIK